MATGGTSQPRGALLIQNLPALQGLLKRDPLAYADEFKVQWQHYESQRRLIELGMAGKEAEERWRDLVGFIAQVRPWLLLHRHERVPEPAHRSPHAIRRRQRPFLDTLLRYCSTRMLRSRPILARSSFSLSFSCATEAW